MNTELYQTLNNISSERRGAPAPSRYWIYDRAHTEELIRHLQDSQQPINIEVGCGIQPVFTHKIDPYHPWLLLDPDARSIKDVYKLRMFSNPRNISEALPAQPIIIAAYPYSNDQFRDIPIKTLVYRNPDHRDFPHTCPPYTMFPGTRRVVILNDGYQQSHAVTTYTTNILKSLGYDVEWQIQEASDLSRIISRHTSQWTYDVTPNKT